MIFINYLENFISKNIIFSGFLASFVAGLATVLGAFFLLLFKKVSKKFMDASLGFAAGVMLAASIFSLIIPALNIHKEKLLSVIVVSMGILIGAVFIDFIDKNIPHEHFIKGHEGDISKIKKIWLFIIAITLHNFPEGLAVGAGFGTGLPEQIKNGLSLTLGIGLQNIPEGMAVAFSLFSEKTSVKKAIFVSFLTGLVEPIGGLVGVLFVNIASSFLPWGMAFAAGAMLFVISDEIIPETHRGGFERLATFSVLIGFCVMMFLDVLLG